MNGIPVLWIGSNFCTMNFFRFLPVLSCYKLNNNLSDKIFWINCEKTKITLLLDILNKHQLIKADTLLDIWALDYPNAKTRYTVCYNLVSTSFNLRFLITVLSAEPTFQSVSLKFSSAGWLEREVWDMHGIWFEGNTDLRRILTDYGFVGFPLRKDFPLSGFSEVRYSEEIQSCSYEPIMVSQEFRFFDYSSPWTRTHF